MRTPLVRLTLTCAVAAAATLIVSAQQAPAVTNVLFVTMDGMRWQEVFGGLQAALLTKDEGGLSGGDIDRLKERFDAPTPEQRRERLMPFLWTSLARQGQIFGDASRGSLARVTNGL